MIHASSPGKLIMFGEHASRHGRPSLVFAVNQRLHVFIKPRNDDKIYLSSERMGVNKQEHPSKEMNYVSACIDNFFETTNVKKTGFDLEVKSDITAGFGSSAATVVSTLGALDGFYKTKLTKKQLLDLAFKTSSGVSGIGSGQDVAAAIYGGLIRFVRGTEPVQIPYKDLPIVIGYTGVKAPSAPIVKAVQYLEGKFPTIIMPNVDNIERIVKRAEEAILANDMQTVGELMNINHGLLNSLGVSSIALEKLIFAARDAGALGAKLSGAGIGDNMIALAPGKMKEVSDAINKAGGQALDATIDKDGLLVVSE